MGATSRSRLTNSAGAVNFLNVKGAAGLQVRLFHVTVYSANAAARYLHLFNAASQPSLGTVPYVPPYTVPIGGAAVNPTEIDLGIDGAFFPQGCFIALSSTQTTYTAIASNDGYFFVIFL